MVPIPPNLSRLKVVHKLRVPENPDPYISSLETFFKIQNSCVSTQQMAF